MCEQMTKLMKEINLLYIDLFCGAGGTSSGVEYARVDGKKCAEVIACVNHDANAIKSHAANHPKTMHFTEDIRTLDLTPLIRHLQKNPAIDTVNIAPFMFVAGESALEGVCGDAENSMKSRIAQAGYKVIAHRKCLGEYEGIRRIYRDHLNSCFE